MKARHRNITAVAAGIVTLVVAACGGTHAAAPKAHPSYSATSNSAAASPSASPSPVITRSPGDVTGSWTGSCNFTTVSGDNLSFSNIQLNDDGTATIDDNQGTWAKLKVQPPQKRPFDELSILSLGATSATLFTFKAQDNGLVLTYAGSGNPAGSVKVLQGQFQLGVTNSQLQPGQTSGQDQHCTLTATS